MPTGGVDSHLMRADTEAFTAGLHLLETSGDLRMLEHQVYFADGEYGTFGDKRQKANSLQLPTKQHSDAGVARSKSASCHDDGIGPRLYGFSKGYIEEEETWSPHWLDEVIESIIPSGSVRGAVFNLCSATLGAGALSLPYGFDMAGIIPTTLSLALAGVATVYSIWVLVEIYERTGVRTYEESTEVLAGSWMRHAVEGLTIVFCFGCAVAYVIAIGDTMAPVQKYLPLSTNELKIGFWAIFMVPTSCLREVNSLRFTSLLGVLCMLYLCFATIYHGMTSPSDHHCTRDIRWAPLSAHTILSMPIVLFAYTCQINVFAIYDELDYRNPHTMKQVSWGGVAICFFVYGTIGLAGYMAYGQCTMANILGNFKEDSGSIVIIGAYMAVAVAITMAFPLVIYPLRASINLALYRKIQLTSTTFHLVETMALLLSILFVAILIPDISVVFQLLGSTASSMLCFVFPAYLGFKARIHYKQPRHLLGMAALIVAGVGIGVLGTFVTVMDMMKK